MNQCVTLNRNHGEIKNLSECVKVNSLLTLQMLRLLGFNAIFFSSFTALHMSLFANRSFYIQILGWYLPGCVVTPIYQTILNNFIRFLPVSFISKRFTQLISVVDAKACAFTQNSVENLIEWKTDLRKLFSDHFE